MTPGIWTQPLEIASMNVDVDGEPNVLCQKLMVSSAVVKRTAGEAESILLVGVDAKAVSGTISSTVDSFVEGERH